MVTVDRYTRFMLTVIAVLLAVVAVGLWCETPDAVPHAQAYSTGAGEQLNPGKQLNDVVKNTEKISTVLTELQKLLVSGSVKVQVIEAPDKTNPTNPTPVTQSDIIK